MYYKYSKTLHLPFSPGLQNDDRLLPSVEVFVGREVVVSEKMDAENTTLYRDHLHARSVDSKHHPSRNWIKAFHGSICNDIPDGFRICGENMYAMHSIHYRSLPSYFLVFGIYDENNICLSWDKTVEWCELLGLETVPVLYRGIWDEKLIKECWTGKNFYDDRDEQEGYVVRTADAFPYDDFADNVTKFVRKGHVQTSEHWMLQKIVPNLLRK